MTRNYVIHGRVQGVGFRAFVQRRAAEIGVDGWVRNLDSGDVEVLASGTEAQLAELAGALRLGPMWSEVRSIEEREAAPESALGFRIR